MIQKIAPIVVLGVLFLVPANASERQFSRYDELGRLVSACHTTDSKARRQDYILDKADNRQWLSDQTLTSQKTAGQSFDSADGRFHLKMQHDNNFVLTGPGPTTLWSSNTAGTGANKAVMQSDGNLVLYNSSNSPIWNTGTSGNYCSSLTVQNDGNVFITSYYGTILWSTNTGGH